MRIFDRSTAESYAVEGVEVTRWEQYQLERTVPFQAMWYEVPVGGTAPLDRHPERELSIVVHGTAEIEVGGTVRVVSQGGAFLLDGQEAHRVRNPSTVEPLLVFSAYWMPDRAISSAVPAGVDGGRSDG